MKKRYHSADEIIKDIDRCYRLAAKAAKKAEELDKQADEWFREPTMVEQAKGARLYAAKTRQRSHNYINKKAKKLGEKLSEIRTGTMTFIPDGSIPA